MDWFMTLFSRMSLPLGIRVFDVFLVESWSIVFKIGITLMRMLPATNIPCYNARLAVIYFSRHICRNALQGDHGNGRFRLLHAVVPRRCGASAAAIVLSPVRRLVQSPFVCNIIFKVERVCDGRISVDDLMMKASKEKLC